jgi:protein ImuB
MAEESAVCALEYPTNDREILEHRLRRLVDQVSANLAERRRGALRLLCRLEMVQHPPDVFEVGLFSPTSDATHLSRLITTSLEGRHLPCMVQKLSLAVTLGGPLLQYQPTMFGDDSISQVSMRRSLAQMIETLAGRLGRDCVVGIESSRNPLPEAAYKPKPMAGESHRTLSLGKASASRSASLKSPRQSILPPALGPLPHEPMRRPLRLFVVPEPLEVIEWGDEMMPCRIRVAHRVHRIMRHWGPERIETGWWDGPQIRRDYYRIEIECGAWWWVFRQLRGNASAAWMLHGQFT